jgi:hypothetical protein
MSEGTCLFGFSVLNFIMFTKFIIVKMLSNNSKAYPRAKKTIHGFGINIAVIIKDAKP